MASAGSLASDLEELRVNNIKIKDYKKTVKLLENKPVTDNRIRMIHNYKFPILQLETRNKDLRDKIYRC